MKQNPAKYKWFQYKDKRKVTVKGLDVQKDSYEITLEPKEIFGLKKVRNGYHFVTKEDYSDWFRLPEFDANRLIKNSSGWTGKVGRNNVVAGEGGMDTLNLERKAGRGVGRKEIRVNSTVFGRALYNAKAKTLWVVFRNGSVWEYQKVTPDEALEFEKSKSQGAYFNDVIKQKPQQRINSA